MKVSGVFVTIDANITPPNCPNPSFKIQFNVAANGIDPDPTPIADNNACIDNTPPAEDSVTDTIWPIINTLYPELTEYG